ATIPTGQGGQALTYVPNAVPEGDGMQNLQPLPASAAAATLMLAPPGKTEGKAPTSVTLFEQGLTQIVQAAVTGLAPKQPYGLALAGSPDGSGPIDPLAAFTTNPAGAAIVNAVGPIRQIVRSPVKSNRRYLVIVSGT